MPDPVSVKLGALVAEPPVLPNTYVLVIEASAVNPPVPVQVKLVILVAIDNTVVPAVVCTSKILFAPNAIERTLVPAEANIPVVKVNPFKLNAPAVNVVVRVAPNVNALPKDQPPATPLNVIEQFNVVPFVVTVLPVVVELNVIVPVLFQTVPVTNDILPDA